MNNPSARHELRCAFLLFLTAAIWGFAMAFQREGSRYLQPFTFNAARYTVGIVSLLPLLLREIKATGKPLTKKEALKGAVQGLVLFLASFLQQSAVGEAGAGKAGFLTALYVVMVPALGALIGKRTQITTWLALLAALPALYLLCVPAGERFTLAASDSVLLLSSVVWAVQILCMDRFVQSVSPLKLCTMQFISAVMLNWIFAFVFEHPSRDSLFQAMIPILYTGVMSTGVGYLFQAMGQKGCRPAFAALIMSLESVFCVIAGAVMLGERMNARGYIGCALMLAAVLIAQAGGLLRLKGGSGRV
ncbi:MAG: DMT family transporter [Clostridia bacterium]|nr:DMT family transporter [Clostridia bacterium]